MCLSSFTLCGRYTLQEFNNNLHFKNYLLMLISGHINSQEAPRIMLILFPCSILLTNLFGLLVFVKCT